MYTHIHTRVHMHTCVDHTPVLLTSHSHLLLHWCGKVTSPTSALGQRTAAQTERQPCSGGSWHCLPSSAWSRPLSPEWALSPLSLSGTWWTIQYWILYMYCTVCTYMYTYVQYIRMYCTYINTYSIHTCMCHDAGRKLGGSKCTAELHPQCSPATLM